MKDIQASKDERNVIIDSVGVKSVKFPIRVSDKQGHAQDTVAEFNMYVELPAHFKGTNMSRFLEVLHDHRTVMSVENFEGFAGAIIDRLGSEKAHIEAEFTFFRSKKAPVSGIASLMDYKVKLGIHALKTNGIGREGRVVDSMDFLKKISVSVPATSLCPCSKEISKYGAHNQRSLVEIEIETKEMVWIEDLIDIAEKSASCELYTVLKRPDEKAVTERAYENPKFVEDIVRDVALEVAKLPGLVSYQIICENFESIHNHSAYARIARVI